MSSCFDKLLKLIKQPIPEAVLGKLTFSVRKVLFENLEKTSRRPFRPSQHWTIWKRNTASSIVVSGDAWRLTFSASFACRLSNRQTFWSTSKETSQLCDFGHQRRSDRIDGEDTKCRLCGVHVSGTHRSVRSSKTRLRHSGGYLEFRNFSRKWPRGERTRPNVRFQIELATNAYPYSNCRGDFDVMSRIVTEAAPSLPADREFSDEFRSFVNMW